MCRSVSKKKGFEFKMTTCPYDRITDSNKDKFHCIKDRGFYIYMNELGVFIFNVYMKDFSIFIFMKDRGDQETTIM